MIQAGWPSTTRATLGDWQNATAQQAVTNSRQNNFFIMVIIGKAKLGILRVLRGVIFRGRFGLFFFYVFSRGLVQTTLRMTIFV